MDREFNTKKHLPRLHENDAINSYLTVSYAGRKLMEEHQLNEQGIWIVKGEDPNCDIGGAHHEPDLGTFKGTLKEVLELAFNLPRWLRGAAAGQSRSTMHQKF